LSPSSMASARSTCSPGWTSRSVFLRTRNQGKFKHGEMALCL
jgi:hypothetical protein